MTEDELKKIEERVEKDDDEENEDLDTDDLIRHFAQACVDRHALVAEVRRMRSLGGRSE